MLPNVGKNLNMNCYSLLRNAQIKSVGGGFVLQCETSLWLFRLCLQRRSFTKHPSLNWLQTRTYFTLIALLSSHTLSCCQFLLVNLLFCSSTTWASKAQNLIQSLLVIICCGFLVFVFLIRLRLNAYFHEWIIFMYIFGFWGMASKQIYAACYQFIGNLEGINPNKFNSRLKKNFSISKLIFWSKWSTKLDDCDSHEVSEVFGTCWRSINVVFW